jgi:hypothetical protein
VKGGAITRLEFQPTDSLERKWLSPSQNQIERHPTAPKLYTPPPKNTKHQLLHTYIHTFAFIDIE